jgi:hemerythrin-like domain-containing protein
MNPSITALCQEHRKVETLLEILAESIRGGNVDAEAFRNAAALTAQHYSLENEFLNRLERLDSVLTRKLRAQHGEAMEIAARLQECFDAGEGADVLYLARRFAAIVQHNIIEEERDVFPLAGGLR